MEAWLRLQVGGAEVGPAHLRDGAIVAEALANIQPDRFYNLRYIVQSPLLSYVGSRLTLFILVL
jgi:hypothetical protein